MGSNPVRLTVLAAKTEDHKTAFIIADISNETNTFNISRTFETAAFVQQSLILLWW